MQKTKIKKPNLFIVGKPKAGTTALFIFLDQHPNILMSKVKEPHYFAKDLNDESDKFHKKKKYFHYRTEEKYLKLFEKWNGEKIVGEGTTDYLYSKIAAKEIHEFNPNAKIIIMLREPVDFLYSRHAQNLMTTGETVEDFKTALLLEEERKKGKHIPKKVLVPSLLYYSERAKYSEQLQRYINLFNKNQIKIIIFDDFKKDNARVYKEVLKFLNVDPNFKPPFKKINKNRQIKFKRIKRLIESPYIWKLPKKVMPEMIYNKTKNLFYKITTKYKPRPTLDQKLKKGLMKKYKPEVKRLSKMLDIDLIKLWGYDKIK